MNTIAEVFDDPQVLARNMRIDVPHPKLGTVTISAISYKHGDTPGITATPGNGQVTLGWTASAGATSYNVKRATVSGGPYAVVGTPSSNSYPDIGLTNGTTYYYVVSAVNGGGESANSAQVSATPQGLTARSAHGLDRDPQTAQCGPPLDPVHDAGRHRKQRLPPHRHVSGTTTYLDPRERLHECSAETPCQDALIRAF